MNHPHRTRMAGIVCALMLVLGAGFVAKPDVQTTVNQVGSYPTWPSGAEWSPVANFYDPVDAGTASYLDFVGDATYPLLYRATKAIVPGVLNVVYFRIRVNYSGDVTTSDPFAKTGTIGLLINSDTSDDAPDYGFLWDAKSDNNVTHGLELVIQNVVGTKWKEIKMADADGASAAKVWNTTTNEFDFRYDEASGGVNSTDAFVRTIDHQTTSWGDTTFIDFAIICDFFSTVRTEDALKYTLLCGQSWQLQVASIANANDHNFLDADIGNNATPESNVAGTWSATQTTLVELGDFGARYEDRRMRVAWDTHSETDNAGFHLWRSDRPAAGFVRVTPSMILAKGSPYGPARYSFEDAAVRPGQTYYYKLEDIDMSGLSTFHGPIVAFAGTIVPLAPPDGDRPIALSPPEFSWDGGGFGTFKLELSADPGFSGSCLTLPANARSSWTPATSLRPNRREWERVKALAGSAGIVYWRVHGMTLSGAVSVSSSRWLKIR